jgi:hypothetical protein
MNNSCVLRYCLWNVSVKSCLGDAENDGDLGDEVSELEEAAFFDPKNFPCFDFRYIWVMSENIIEGENPSEYPLLRTIVNGIAIPILTEWAVIIFIALLSGLGGWFVWKRFA